jgi:hypothetical protein
VSLLQELTLADARIVAAKARIAQQLQRIGRLIADGKDAADALAMLRVMRLSLTLLQGHRQQLGSRHGRQGG